MMEYKGSLAVGMTADGQVTGFASTYATVDRVKEAVVRGAFWGQPYTDLPTLAYHDPKMPVGTGHYADDEGKHGLWADVKFVPGDADAEKIRNLVRYKAIPAMSIGYNVVESHKDRVTGVRHLTKLDLMEVSFVPIPANPDARVYTAKHFGTEVTEALALSVKSLFGYEPDNLHDIEEIVEEAKAGRRNSATDQMRLQAAHDYLTECGAECAMGGKSAPFILSPSFDVELELLAAEL